MKTENLIKNNILAIPVGDFLHKDMSAAYMIYAPFAGIEFIADADYVMRLDTGIGRQCGISDEQDDIISQLLGTPETKKSSVLKNALEDSNVLYVIPNYKCNFSCSYCYAAAGRSSKEIEAEDVQNTVSFFIERKEPTDESPLRIVFIGGGEPMLSWSIVYKIIVNAQKTASKLNKKIAFTIITNGSILTDSMLQFIKQYDIRINVSFEILKEIQNSQRGSYDVVVQNIHKLLKNAVKVNLRATITDLNVALMPQMIEETAAKFPGVKSVFFETVSLPQNDSAAKMHQFLDDYYKWFKLADECAEKNNLTLFNSQLVALDHISENFCSGLITLTPERTFTLCPCFSSPNEKYYEQNTIGYIRNGGIDIAEEKYQDILNQHSCKKTKCRTCFAKYNCGGGCIYRNLIYSEETKKVICQHTREYMRYFLFKRICKNYRAQTNRDMISDLLEKL